jgi:hypothetical protein
MDVIMKKKMLLYLVLSAPFCALNAEKITINLPQNDCPVQCEKGIATFNDTPLFGCAGEPELPVTYTTVLLPPDADFSSVKVSVEQAKEAVYTTSVAINPVLPKKTTDGFVALEPRKRISNGYDTDVYATDAYFPRNYIRSVQPGQMREYKLLDITIQRAKYNPVSGKLSTLSGGSLVISYTRTREQIHYTAPTTSDAQNLVMERAVNYASMAGTYAGLRVTSNKTYAIFTLASTQSALTGLTQYVNIRKNEGYNVIVVTESAWGGGSGTTAVTNIRKWLKSNYQSQGIQYVLFIGDPSGNSQLAMVLGPTASNKTPLTDYCYADLTGAATDFTTNRYYEYADEGPSQNSFDKYAEVNVGRIPLYNNNIADVEYNLKKIIKYVTETKELAEAWRFSCFMPLHTFGDAQNGYSFGEYIKSKVLVPNKWTPFRLYDDHMGVGAEGYPCSYANTKKYWSAGKFGIMICQGHGTVTSADQTSDVSTARSLTDAYPTHCFNVSCNNGKPDDAGNLGYAEFRYPGISAIASAVQIWYNQSTASYGSSAAGNDFGFVYIKHLVVSKLPAAAAFNKCRSELPISGTSDWQNCVELNLYGCPATGIFTYGVSSVTGVIAAQSTIAKSPLCKVRVLPATQKALFIITGNGSVSGVIAIYGLSGELITTLSVHKGNTPAMWDFGREHRPAGLYLVRSIVTGERGSIVTTQQRVLLR